MNKTYYYKSFSDDIVKSDNQDFKLKEDYMWIKNNIIYRACSWVVYFVFYIIRNCIFKSYFTCKT